MKGLRASIYKNPFYAECSNNGISKFCDEVTIIANDLFPEIPPIFEQNDKAPAVTIEKRNVRGKDFFMPSLFRIRIVTRWPEGLLSQPAMVAFPSCTRSLYMTGWNK